MAQRVEVEPGVFRPRGALGPLTNAEGEVVPRDGWPHRSSGLEEITPGQRAYLDAVSDEGAPDYEEGSDL